MLYQISLRSSLLIDDLLFSTKQQLICNFVHSATCISTALVLYHLFNDLKLHLIRQLVVLSLIAIANIGEYPKLLGTYFSTQMLLEVKIRIFYNVTILIHLSFLLPTNLQFLFPILHCPLRQPPHSP